MIIMIVKGLDRTRKSKINFSYVPSYVNHCAISLFVLWGLTDGSAIFKDINLKGGN